MTLVATVRALARYPVKSMRGEELAAAELGLQGVAGDRRYAFVQAGARGLFPWLSAREYPDLLRYRPMYDTSTPRPRLRVLTPAGAVLTVDGDELRRELEEGADRPLYLLADHRGNYDVGQVSLISLATVARIAETSATPPDPARFRANLVVEAVGGAPFTEEAWVGHILRIGETARLAVTESDERCVMVTLDPHTGAATPAVLRTVAALHGNRAGIYGVVLTPGAVRPGDPIHLEP